MTTSSKVTIVFTRDHGKLRFAARGARRPRSRFGASLELITHASFVYYRQQSRELQTLSEGDIVYAFTELKADYRRMVCASAVCDLLDHMTADEDPNKGLFQTAMDALHWLERIPSEAIEVPLWYFQLRGAEALGYRPHLESCVKCGRAPEPPRARFSPQSGGVVCRACGTGGVTVDTATLSYLARLLSQPRHAISLDAVAAVDQVTARAALRSYLEYHLESRRHVRALDFLDKMMVDESKGPASRAAEAAAPTYAVDAGPGPS